MRKGEINHWNNQLDIMKPETLYKNSKISVSQIDPSLSGNYSSQHSSSGCNCLVPEVSINQEDSGLVPLTT